MPTSRQSDNYQLRGKELILKIFEKLTEEEYKAVAVCSYIKVIKTKDNYWKNIIE